MEILPANIPPELLLEVTSKCNYHCPWCYCVWHEIPSAAMRDLSGKSWKKIIQQALNCDVRALMFTGGEVTMRHDWHQLLSLARECSDSVVLSLFTNGSRFTLDDLQFCKKLQVYLTTSLQGLREYREMTGTRRSYRKTIELLVAAKEIGWPASASITVNKVNLHELADICGAAILSGASSIQVNAMMLEGKARNRTDLALNLQEWNLAKKSISELYSDYKSFIFSDETLCHCRIQPESLKPWNLDESRDCPAGTAFGVINPQGYYRKCLHTPEIICHWTQLLNNKGEKP